MRQFFERLILIVINGNLDKLRFIALRMNENLYYYVVIILRKYQRRLLAAGAELKF